MLKSVAHGEPHTSIGNPGARGPPLSMEWSGRHRMRKMETYLSLGAEARTEAP
jgi:hypothetical protein